MAIIRRITVLLLLHLRRRTDKDKSGEEEGNTTEDWDIIARQWNCVDTNSPLMGNQEEPQWVLKRLTRTLQRELRALNSALDEELTGEGREQDRDRGETIQ